MAYFHTTVVDNQIKALDTIGTAVGSICTFDTDRAERLVKCVCEVASGNSEINVTACGKNLCNSNAITDVVFNDQQQTRKGVLIPCGGTFTISVKRPYTNNTWIFAKAVNADGTFEPVNYVIQGTITNVITITVQNGGHLIVYAPETAELTKTIFEYCELQIEKGNRTTEYEPYNGTTYNIQFGETLSDTATYDAISGVLTRNDTTTKQLDSCNIVALDNKTNNVYCDTGNTEVNYIMTVGQAIS